VIKKEPIRRLQLYRRPRGHRDRRAFDLQDRRRAAAFPDEVYRESPRLREYRYIERDDRTYIIEPGERRIIEEIDD
jgi:hypothetical protein